MSVKPRLLLPSSAMAFASRAQPYIVLKREYCHWLAKILKQARPGYDIICCEYSTEQATLLSILLAPDTALWTICEMDLVHASHKASEEEGMSQASLAEARYIQAHVVHIDTISRVEMSFKLTSNTIENLINLYDKNISCHTSSSISNGPQKVTTFHNKDPKQAFVQKVNEFVFCTHVTALKSLGGDGTGTLIGRQAMAARQAINHLLVSDIAPQQEGSLR